MRQGSLAFTKLLLSSLVVASWGYISPAHALSCVDIPGAKIDTGLDAVIPYENFGRLLPEFKSKTIKTRSNERTTVNRLYGKIYKLPDDAGHVFVWIADDGGSQVRARIGGIDLEEGVPDQIAGLSNKKHDSKLSEVFSQWAIEPDALVPAKYPANISSEDLAGFSGAVRVGQTTQTLRAPDQVSTQQSVEYSCSSDAEFAGDPDKLPTFVVIRGTVKAVATTTHTVTERYLDLTVEDFVEVSEGTREDISEALGALPKIAAAVLGEEQAPDNNDDTALVLPAPTNTQTDPSHDSRLKVETAPQSVQLGEPKPAAEPATGWQALFSLLAGLAAVVLALLFIPQITARQRASSPRARDDSEARFDTASVAVPVANDNANSQQEITEPAVSKTIMADGASTSPEALQARIDVLETLQRESGEFRQKIDNVLKGAKTDIADTVHARDELERLRSTAAELESANEALQNSADQTKSELSLANEQALQLKHKTADMGVRLAKATAIAETSQSIISELENASETAVALSAEYRDKSRAMEAEAASLRSKLDGVEATAGRREELLESAMQSNEELDQALQAEQAERANLAQELERLKQEQHSFVKNSSDAIDALKARSNTAGQQLDELRVRERALENQLTAAISDRKQSEENAQIVRKDSVRMRVDYGVRAKLLEDNIVALTSHIDELETILRAHKISVPKYLNVANIFDRSASHSVAAKPVVAQRPHLVALKGDKREAG